MYVTRDINVYDLKKKCFVLPYMRTHFDRGNTLPTLPTKCKRCLLIRRATMQDDVFSHWMLYF